MQEEKKLCPCCGAKLTGRDERISKGVATSLIKFREAAILSLKYRGLNKVHLAKDLDLTKNQYNNFQKLRYHGLIAHYKDKETKEYESGYWLLTKRGNSFAKNECSISKKVVIFRNKIVERSDEKITLKEVLKENLPFWDKHDDFGFYFDDVDDYNKQNEQLELF